MNIFIRVVGIAWLACFACAAFGVDLKPPASSSGGGGGAPSGSAGGDLGGTYPSPTVTVARGVRETSGPTSLTMAGVVDGQVLVRSGTTVTSVALPTALPPNGSASGDLGGTYPSPTVTQARGILETSGPTNLVVGAIADGQKLVRSGGTLIGQTNTVGDVVGPASSTTTQLAAFSGTTGKLLAGVTGVTNPSSGALTLTGQLNSASLLTTAAAVIGTSSTAGTYSKFATFLVGTPVALALSASTSTTAPTASFQLLTVTGTATTAWTPAAPTSTFNGAIVYACNVDAAGDTITLTDGASLDGAGSVMDTGDCVTLIYDNVNTKWRQVSFSNN